MTSLTLRLHPLGPVTVALLLWEPAEAGRVLRAYRDFVEAAPDDVGGGSVYLTAPPEDFVPEDMAGRLALGILLVVAAPEAAGRAAMAPMLGLGHRGEMIAEMPYAELQCLLDDPPGYRNYWSAEYLRALPDAAIDAFVASADDMIVPSPSQHALFPRRRRGGARDRRLAGAVAARALVRASVRPVDRPGRRRPRPAVGARRARGGGALGDRRGLPELHRRRGRGPGRRRLRRGGLPAARRG